jgi:hypothetical protein
MINIYGGVENLPSLPHHPVFTWHTKTYTMHLQERKSKASFKEASLFGSYILNNVYEANFIIMYIVICTSCSYSFIGDSETC